MKWKCYHIGTSKILQIYLRSKGHRGRRGLWREEVEGGMQITLFTQRILSWEDNQQKKVGWETQDVQHTEWIITTPVIVMGKKIRLLFVKISGKNKSFLAVFLRKNFYTKGKTPSGILTSIWSLFLCDGLWGGFFFLVAKHVNLGENLYECK